jgi:hypothetical protein
LESAGRAGTGVEGRRSQGKGAESRPGMQLFLSFVFVFVFVLGSDGGERRGLTSWPRPGGGNPMYICHGRKAAVCNMKKQNKTKGRIFQQHVCSGKRTLISSFAVGVSRKCSKFGNCRIFWIALSSSRLTASAPRPEGADVRPRDEPSDGADGGSFGESSSSRTYCSL